MAVISQPYPAARPRFRIPTPPCQTVSTIVARHPWHLASAVLAAASDATVCQVLDEAASHAARQTGLALVSDPDAAHFALVELGLALVPIHACGPAQGGALHTVHAHPGQPARVLLCPDPADGDPGQLAREFAGSGLEGVLLTDGERCWHVDGSRLRRPRLPPPPPLPPAGADLLDVFRNRAHPAAERVAWEAAAVLWVGRWLPRFEDVLDWTRDRLRRGVDLRPYLTD